MIKRKDFIWNILGSTIYGISGILLIIIINLLSGSYVSGRFSVAFVTAQMFMYVGNYGVRVYQASDINEKYTFNDYFTYRIVTCLMMILCGLLFSFYRGYNYSMGNLIVVTCTYKAIDALADVFEGRLQQKNLFYLSGKSLFFRTIVSSVVLIVSLYITKSLLVASYITLIFSILLCIIFSIYPALRYTNISLQLKFSSIKSILIECFPLFTAMFMLSYIINAPKYAIENTLDYNYQTYFNALYFPAQTIYLITSFLFKPLLVGMATDWLNVDTRYKVRKLVKFLLSVIFILTSLLILTANFIGIPILNFLFRLEFVEYKNLMLIMIIGGGLIAIINMLYNVLTIMRLQRYIFVSYLIIFIFSFLLPPIFVERYMLVGAVYSYDILLAILAFLLLCFYSLDRLKEDSNR